MSADLINLLELDGYTAASTYATHRYCTHKQGYRSKPTDAPPNTPYSDRVVNLAIISRAMFAGGASGAKGDGGSEVGHGFSELANRDGGLDALFGPASGISFRERPARMLQVAPGAARSTAVLVQRAVVSQIEKSRDLATVHFKDRLYELDTPHLTITYAGTNALPAGVEGVSDLAGKVKPEVFGTVFQVEPPCVNTSKLIYQISRSTLLSATVYDGGVSTTFTVGTAYSSQADMEATAPSVGEVRFWLPGGMFRLGSSPTHRITVDAAAHSAANSTAAQLLKALALARGIDAGDISSAHVAALDVANSAVLGTWVNDSRTTRSIMDDVARSVGAYVGFSAAGVLEMARFEEAAGTPVAVVAPWNVDSVEEVAGGEDIPVSTVRLRYARYQAPQSGAEVSGSLSAASKADLGQEWRVSEATSTPSPNPYRRLQTIERDTLFAYKAAADAEAARLLVLYGTPRRTHVLRSSELDATTLRALDVNAVVELRWPRYGFSREVGTLRRVLAIVKNETAKRADITVWGA